MKSIKSSSVIKVAHDNVNMGLTYFLDEAKDAKGLLTTNYIVSENLCRVHDLLSDGEYIQTRANEVPSKNGSWHYNDATYDLYYMLLEDNTLLVIEQRRSIDYFPGDPVYVKFSLYPNAHQFVLKTCNGHRDTIPYINIVNCNGNLISEFHFEMPSDKSVFFNNVPLYEVLKPVNIEYLKSKCQGGFQDKQHVLCQKK